MKELQIIQQKLNAPKDKYNSFGKYSYRSCEGILEALKPILKETACTLIISDEIVEIAGRVYVKAVASLTNSDDERVQVTAFAREAENKSGMDTAQITGAASSYARKYALNGLFLIDDNKDPDTEEYAQAAAKQKQTVPAKQVKQTGNGGEAEKARAFLAGNAKAFEYYQKRYSHFATLEQFDTATLLAIYGELLKGGKL